MARSLTWVAFVALFAGCALPGEAPSTMLESPDETVEGGGGGMEAVALEPAEDSPRWACGMRVEANWLYPPDELAERAGAEASSEEAVCVLTILAFELRSWNGSRYDAFDLVVDPAAHPPAGRVRSYWEVRAEGSWEGTGKDVYLSVVSFDGAEAVRVWGPPADRGALPPARIAVAREVFEASEAWEEVREFAPRFSQARWNGSFVEVAYDGRCPSVEEEAERAFSSAVAVVQPDDRLVEEVVRARWGVAPTPCDGYET